MGCLPFPSLEWKCGKGQKSPITMDCLQLTAQMWPQHLRAPSLLLCLSTTPRALPLGRPETAEPRPGWGPGWSRRPQLPCDSCAAVPAACMYPCIFKDVRSCSWPVPEGRDLELIGTASGRFATHSPWDSPGAGERNQRTRVLSPSAAETPRQRPPAGVGCLKLRARRTEARNGFPGKYRSTSFLLPY